MHCDVVGNVLTYLLTYCWPTFGLTYFPHLLN